MLIILMMSVTTHYARYTYTFRSSGVRARYSRSMSPSIRFLMTTGDGKNLVRSCIVTSDTKQLCCNGKKKCSHFQNTVARWEHGTLTVMRLRDFMIRTIAASISCFRSSSTLLRVSLRSGSDSPFAATV